MMNQSGFPLMNELVSSMNIDRAIEKVKKNKGAPGIDDMTVSEIKSHLNKYRRPFVQKLREGTYRPQPTKRVEIPKGNGKKRKLSIPVVRDRVVQQMILQVITPLIDPTFSENSYGFRPGKSCQQAIAKAYQYYEEGYDVVVDCDLKSYFDTINHQKLMHRMQWYIEEKSSSPTYLEFLKRRSNGGRNSSSNFKRSLPREPAFSSFSQCLSGPIGQGTRKKKPSVYSIRGRFYYLCPKRARSLRESKKVLPNSWKRNYD